MTDMRQVRLEFIEGTNREGRAVVREPLEIALWVDWDALYDGRFVYQTTRAAPPAHRGKITRGPRANKDGASFEVEWQGAVGMLRAYFVDEPPVDHAWEPGAVLFREST